MIIAWRVAGSQTNDNTLIDMRDILYTMGCGKDAISKIPYARLSVEYCGERRKERGANSILPWIEIDI